MANRSLFYLVLLLTVIDYTTPISVSPEHPHHHHFLSNGGAGRADPQAMSPPKDQCVSGEGCSRTEPGCAGEDPEENEDKLVEHCATATYIYGSYQMEAAPNKKSPIWVQKSKKSKECMKCGGFDQVNCLGMCNGMDFDYFRCTPCYCNCSD